jgi:hypothetical protein
MGFPFIDPEQSARMYTGNLRNDIVSIGSIYTRLFKPTPPKDNQNLAFPVRCGVSAGAVNATNDGRKMRFSID